MYPFLLNRFLDSCSLSNRATGIQKSESNWIESLFQQYPFLRTIIGTESYPVLIPSDPALSDYAFSEMLAPYETEQKICGGNQTFKYILGELVDNVYEHSSFSVAVLSTIKNIDNEYFEICLFDNGISIPRSFEKVQMKFTQDSEAIVEAINGLSSKPSLERGTGLRTTVDILLNGLQGKIIFVSRMGAFYVDSVQRTRYNLIAKQNLNGTFINIRVPYPSEALNLYNYVY